MTELEFKSLADQGYNRIPIMTEALADLETPLSLYLKLAQSQTRGVNTFLLESVVGGERFGRYSFIGLHARTLLRAYGQRVEVVTDGKVVETHEGNPLDFIATFEQRFKVALRPGLPRFCGGLAGYFGYDAVRYIEKTLASTQKPDDLGLPDIQLLLCEELAVIDNLSGKLYLIVYADPHTPEAYSRARQRLRELRMKLRQPVDVPVTSPSVQTEVYREFDKADYLAAVHKAKEYIMAGDMMQVQIGQRLMKPYRDAPLSLYRALRSLNPSPYMYFYNFGDFQVVGASPEILVRQETRKIGAPAANGTAANGSADTRTSRIVTIRPLAGTRPRGNTPERDAQLATELLNDPKEIAEHVMLIDLARNDIGRIAETGSVKVTDKMVIEKYSHVQHIVSSVEGTLREGMSNLDVLRATFPAGTLSGAPKVRAMEIIDELEPRKRGIYGGAVGYLSFGGEMDLAIAIRTGIIKDGNLYVQAAAGIVADSDPESEWRETEAKARAVIRAAEQVQDGLDSDL
ncbi:MULTISPECIES: anthranilate synthase component I family protein [unclassified Cupriavidus]|uniref:anthranilate synthase component I family protein n=1 Tax=Cupriavidus sp. H19C3 TaxID=3241603 RepID=UPI003BF814AC